MSRLVSYLKEVAEHLPEPVGKVTSRIPFSWRLGSEYVETKREIGNFDKLNRSSKRDYIFKRTRKIVGYAYEKIPFYEEHYDRNGFSPEELQSFDDIRRIPIITKEDLREWPLEKRSVEEWNRLKINTGGTSGNPLEFYVDRNAFAREWAHMHKIWESMGYSPTDLKLTITGENIGDKPYVYNAVHNEYVLNSYKNIEDIYSDIKDIIEKKNIKYIHGYPSATYEFAKYCKNKGREVAYELTKKLEGVFLCSEYPAPVYRDLIEDVFGKQTLSWYGHSEMAILAPEWSSKYVYEPMHTYGLCEAIPHNGNEHKLVGTSYYNTASPFIRYDTGDRIGEIERDGGILQKFKVTKGREGDFVIDRSGHRVSLTGLIYGRHHEIFEKAKFVQVKQDNEGEMTVMVTPNHSSQLTIDDCQSLFDKTNVNIDISFEILNEPIKSPEGKIKLLV